MAIKISGNTVIDDSRNFCNIGTATATCFVGDASAMTNVQVVEVLQPTNTNPADGATGLGLSQTLCGSGYFSLYGKTHTCSCFQVSECSDFSTCNVFTCEIADACTSLAVPSNCLDFSTQYFFRLRYEDEDGCCSQFSDTTCFTTGAALEILGSSTCGGFYMGTICAAGSCYYLIMAPNSSGCSCCTWQGNKNVCNINCVDDGYCNVYTKMNNCGLANFNAGNFTATRSIGGFSDWYLPSVCELAQLYTNCGSAPSGEGFASSAYWSSTECDATNAALIGFGNGNLYTNRSKLNSYKVRAIRREVFP